MPVVLNFETAFSVTNKALYFNRSHPYIERNLFWALQFLVILTLSATSFVFTTNSVLFYDIPNNRFSDASKNGTMAIVSLTITIKYIFLLYKQKYVLQLIERLNRDYEDSKNYILEERDIVLKYSRKGAAVSKYWLLSATSTCILFPIKAIIEMGYSNFVGDFKFVPMFDLRYPNRLEIIKETLPTFYLLFLLCLMFGVLATSMYVGFDPLVPIFLTHICGQLDILSKRMLKIFVNHSSTQEKNEKLKQVNLKLQDLYLMIASIKQKFSFLYEFNMKTTTILLPLSMFQIVEDLRQKEINMEFCCFFFAAILHFYMPCYYCDVLIDRSENLRKAIYSCGWESHPDQHARKTLLLMMTRTTAPLALTTVFYPICLDTFAEMCRQAYAIFNIMNAGLS